MFNITLKDIMEEVHPLEEEDNLRLKCQAIKENANHSESYKPYFYHFKKAKSNEKEAKNKSY